MAHKLTDTINYVFEQINPYGIRLNSRPPVIGKLTKNLEVPLSGTQFEVPAFLLPPINNLLINNREIPDAFIVNLHSSCDSINYKNLENNLKYTLSLSTSHNLVEISVTKGQDTFIYYSINGAVFNEYLKPLMMCCWTIQRYLDQDDNPKFMLVQPVVYIDRDMFNSQSDPMEKLLSGKFLNAAVNANIIRPSIYNNRFMHYALSYNVRVVIDKIPFAIRQTDFPSSDTTNEELIQIAKRHIDEVIV